MALFDNFAKKLHHGMKQHSFLSKKYCFIHKTSPNATGFDLTNAERVSNG